MRWMTRIKHILLGQEHAYVEQMQRLNEAMRRLPVYEQYPGGGFEMADELAALEASMAATTTW